MITAIVTFVLLLALGYIIFIHSGKQEGINKTIGYVVIGVIAVAVIAVPVYSLARGLGGRRDFAGRGSDGLPGVQGGMFAPGFPQQGQGGRFEAFGGCPQGGNPQCPQTADGWSQRRSRRNGQQFKGMPNGGCHMAPFDRQPRVPGQQNPGSQPAIPGTQQGDNSNPDANSGNRQSVIPNRNN